VDDGGRSPLRWQLVVTFDPAGDDWQLIQFVVRRIVDALHDSPVAFSVKIVAVGDRE
jgi:hypothetical protein